MLCPGLMSYGCARKDNYGELVVTRTYVYDSCHYIWRYISDVGDIRNRMVNFFLSLPNMGWCFCLTMYKKKSNSVTYHVQHTVKTLPHGSQNTVKILCNYQDKIYISYSRLTRINLSLKINLRLGAHFNSGSLFHSIGSPWMALSHSQSCDDGQSGRVGL